MRKIRERRYERYDYDLINLILSPVKKSKKKKRRRKKNVFSYKCLGTRACNFLPRYYDTICKSHRLLNLLTKGSPSSGSSFCRSLPLVRSWNGLIDFLIEPPRLPITTRLPSVLFTRVYKFRIVMLPLLPPNLIYQSQPLRIADYAYSYI